MKLSDSTIKRIREQAEQGFPRLQWGLGLIYLEGNGVSRDPSVAFEWFERAANQGHVLAQEQLRQMYDKGLGVEQDYIRAAKWGWMAAEGGHLLAQVALGEYFAYGHGVGKSLEVAYIWLTIAREYGHRSLRHLILYRRVKFQMTLKQQMSAESYISHWELERVRKLAIEAPASFEKMLSESHS